VFGEHLSPHLQSQQVADFAFAGCGVAGVLPAKLVAVSVNRIPEMRTKSFFMFVFEKLMNENIVVKDGKFTCYFIKSGARFFVVTPKREAGTPVEFRKFE
jgi:hypothetical protein